VHEGEAVYTVAIPLRATAYRCAVGHRLRLALSGANFPYIWPSPRRYSLRIFVAGAYQTRLTLPATPPRTPPLPEPDLPPAGDFKPAGALDGGARYRVVKSLTDRSIEFQGERWTRNRVDEHTVFSRSQQFAASVDADHPDRAKTTETAVIRLERPVGGVEVFGRECGHAVGPLPACGDPFRRQPLLRTHLGEELVEIGGFARLQRGLRGI
jgi:hypothetical protein